MSPSGTATGVDISPPRLAATRTLLRKYGAAHNCRLFLADGTTFSERPPTKHVVRKRSKETVLRTEGELAGLGVDADGVDMRMNEDKAKESCGMGTDWGSDPGGVGVETATEAQGRGGSSKWRMASNGLESGVDSLLIASECGTARGVKSAAVQSDPTPAAVRDLRGTEIGNRQAAESEACGAEIGPTEGADCIGESERRRVRAGDNRKEGRRRGRPIGGSESEAQLFFFGRGITPPVLEAADGTGRAELYDKVGRLLRARGCFCRCDDACLRFLKDRVFP